MKKLKRNYNGSDGYMLETSSALHALFVENLADFTAFDSTLDAQYATDWNDEIAAAGTVVQHNQIKDIQVQKTEKVKELMEACRLKYVEVKFFATKVFPKSKGRQAEFGTDTYHKARVKHTTMIAFMDEMHKACEKYTTELLAGGMSQASIDEVAMLRDDLFSANTDQETYSRSTPVLTQERIDVLNDCYAFTRTIIDAAMVIFYNDFARKNMFVYLPTSGDQNDSEIITEEITTENAVLLYSSSFELNRPYRLNNNGPAIVEFFIAELSSDAVKKVTVMPNNFEMVTAADLGDEGSNLFAKLQQGSVTTATVEVEIYNEM